jgi:hypothetical protein
MLYRVSVRLGKTLDEVREIPLAQLYGYIWWLNTYGSEGARL